MEAIILPTSAFLGMFIFAFGMGWFMPLVAVYSDSQKNNKSDFTYSILDILLMLFDCIPVFWLFRVFPASNSSLKRVRGEWTTNKSVRWSFYLFLGSIFSLGSSLLLLL